MPDDSQQQQDDTALYIGGEKVTPEDLTFNEQRKMRDIIRNLAPDQNADNASEADIIPALIYVWKQRTDPSFSLDDALNMRPGDLLAPPTEPAATATKAKTAK